MKMIAGRIKPDAGTITVGATIKIGYYTQEIETGREAESPTWTRRKK